MLEMHVLTMKTHVEWQMAPAAESGQRALWNRRRIGYPVGSMGEFFHPNHDTEIIGKGRCGKHCTTEDIIKEYKSMWAQSMTVTEC